MPAAKQQFFTPVDEANLSQVLKEKFPNVAFVHLDSSRPDGWEERDSIQAFADHWEIDIILKPKGWKPNIVRRELFERIVYIPDNRPDEYMVYQRSQFEASTFDGQGELTVLRDGMFQIGVTDVMTKAQMSLKNKVWRLLDIIGTCRLLGWVGPEGKRSWQELEGRIFCAGNDAIRWAREDKRRVFLSNMKFRPLDE